jgi:hypothetical protein
LHHRRIESDTGAVLRELLVERAVLKAGIRNDLYRRPSRPSPGDLAKITFRKTVDGSGEPGVAEIALRCSRLLGMFARLSGVPWLLIEICAWSLGYGCVSGVFRGPLSAAEPTDGEV